MRVKEENEKAGLKLNIQKTKIMASGPITSWQIEGEKVEAVTDFKITVDGVYSHRIRRRFLFGRKALTKLDSILKSRDIILPTKVHIVKAMFFLNSHVWMWELDHKKGWLPKNLCFPVVVLKKTLESPLGYKIKPVNSKGNQSWIFIGKTDAEAEAPMIWLLDAKSQLIGKDPDSGKGWRQKKNGVAEDEKVR